MANVFGSNGSSFFLDFYSNADRVILVATGSQRLLLISDVEEAQLNGAYRKAKVEKGRTRIQ